MTIGTAFATGVGAGWATGGGDLAASGFALAVVDAGAAACGFVVAGADAGFVISGFVASGLGEVAAPAGVAGMPASALASSLSAIAPSAMAPGPPFACSAFLGCATLAPTGSGGELLVGFEAVRFGSGCRVGNVGPVGIADCSGAFGCNCSGSCGFGCSAGGVFACVADPASGSGFRPMLPGSPGRVGCVDSMVLVGFAGGFARSAEVTSSGRSPAGCVARGRACRISLAWSAAGRSPRLPLCDVSLALIGFVLSPKTALPRRGSARAQHGRDVGA